MPNPLEWLGAVMPTYKGPAPTNTQVTAEAKRKQKQRGEQSQLRKDIGLLGDIAGDFVGGLTGLTSENTPYSAAGYGELLGAASDLIPTKAAVAKGLSLAGMPFAFYKKSGRVGEGLSRARRGTYDIIDESRIGGKERGNVYGPGIYSFEKPEGAKKYHESFQEEGMPQIGGIDVLEPEAKNVLDLVEPNTIDIIKYANTFPESVRETHREFVKNLIARGATSDEAYKQLAPVLRNLTHGNMEAVSGAGFDAIRYPYGGENAWVVPNTTPVYKLGKDTRQPFNQAALNQRREAVTVPSQIQSAPEGFTPIPRSRGARAAKEAVAPTSTSTSTSAPETSKKMSLAELMAMGPVSEAEKAKKLEELRKKRLHRR